MSDQSGNQAEQPEKTAEIKQDASTEKNAPNPPTSIPAGGSVNLLNPQPTPPYQIHIKCCKNETKRWKDYLEIAGFIIGVIVAIIFSIQMYEMIQATGITKGQLDEMKRTRELDERAWVTAEIKADTSESNFITFNVRFTNTGKTPAINGQQITKSNVDIKQIPLHDAPPDLRTNAAIIAPSGSGLFSASIYPVNPIKDAGVFYLYGTIWYDDIFHKPHWTQFCYRISCDTNLTITASPAAIHNSCDDAETNQNN